MNTGISIRTGLLIVLLCCITSPAFSAFTVRGRKLFQNGQPFFIQGVCYHPVPIGFNTANGPAWGDYLTTDYSALHDRDLPLIRAMGANVVRVYAWNPALSHTTLLDRCYNGGINPLHVLVNLWIDPTTNWTDPTAVATLTTQYTAIENQLGNHPAVLGILLGNEANAQNNNGTNPAYWAAMDTIAAAIKAINPARLISVPITDAPTQVTLADSILPHIDFWSLQVYRGTTFGSFFTDFAARSTRPVVITEFGLDAFNHTTTTAYPDNGAYPAQVVSSLWGEILNASATCAGACVFEFSDDWGKVTNPDAHDPGGFALTSFPDGYMDDEWWGLFAVAKNGTSPDLLTPRAIVTQLAQMWNPPGIALIQQPASTNATIGQTTTLTVQAASLSALSYQWRFNATALTGATNASITLSNIQLAQTGNYSVTITNAIGSVTSNPASIAVLNPAINPVVTTGHTVALQAGQGGSYQWQLSTDNGATWASLTDSSTYSGTTTATLTIANASSPLDGFKYRYALTNGTASLISQPVTLAVIPNLFPNPLGLALDSSGSLYVADGTANTIQRVVLATGTATLFAGTTDALGSTDGTGTTARFRAPAGIALDATGNLYVADSGNSTIRKISPAGVVTTVAGSASASGSINATGTAARFTNPTDLCINTTDTLTIADTGNHMLRRITSAGNVTTLAGSASQPGWDDGTGSTARFNNPSGIALTTTDLLYATDTINNTVRLINGATVSTLAGTYGATGTADGTGANALFSGPTGITVDSAGSIYLADTQNSSIRKITATGIVTTVAGTPGLAGLKDGTHLDAWFNKPRDVALDTTGTNLYVADTGNAAIRKIVLATGAVSTLAITSSASTTSSSSSSSSSGAPAPTSGSGGGGAASTLFLTALIIIRLLRHASSNASGPHDRT